MACWTLIVLDNQKNKNKMGLEHWRKSTQKLLHSFKSWRKSPLFSSNADAELWSFSSFLNRFFNDWRWCSFFSGLRFFLRKCVIFRLLAILSPWTSGGLLDFANLERKRFLSMSCTFGAPTSGPTIAAFKDKMTCTYSFKRRLKILKLLSNKLL